MSWKKFFRPVNSVLPVAQRAVDSASMHASTAKYSNWLPEVYSGPPDRLQRYSVYDQMNYDHEISAALDTIADFATDPDEVTKLPLVIEYNDEPTPSEIQILEKSLGQWVRMNKLSRRLWRMFRSVLVYGDQFFIRDPETFELYWIDPAKVEKVIVNESEGKKIESYFIKDIDLNMKNLVATNQLNKASNAAFGSNSIVFSPPLAGNMNYISSGFGGAGSANYQDGGATTVDAEHIVQLSLTDGMNAAWPFGLSILEQIYKVYKQKELLEDAILIYRIHRAPERRMFFIDVGTMPPNKASQYLERIKYEVQQKRIPSRTGGGCFSMDTEVPLLDGRTLSLTQLTEEYNAGKENWAYSCDPATGKMAPGIITWAGVTQKSARVLRLTLDNGETITCTPEHKFPIIGKGFVEAKDISAEDSMISFNSRLTGINEGKHKTPGNTYHQVFDHSDNSWKYTHRVVADFMKSSGNHNEKVYDINLQDEIKKVIHHDNFNRYDNNPNNLYYMNAYDHFLLHSRGYAAYWNSLTSEQKIAIQYKSRMTIGLRSPELAAQISQNRSDGMKKAWNTLKINSPATYKQRVDDNTKNILGKGPVFHNTSKVFNNDMFDILCEYVDSGNTSILTVLDLLSENKTFMLIYSKLNPVLDGKINHLVYDMFCKSALMGLLNKHGYNKWRDFLRSRSKNIRRPTRKLAWNPLMLKSLVDTVKTYNISKIEDAYLSIISNNNFMDMYKTINVNVKGNATSGKFTRNTFRVFLSDHGYAHWTDFKEKISLFNHKVVSIEYLDNNIEVGTLTIDDNEKYHNYHTFAIKQGVYTKNSNVTDSTYNPMSILEDYYFAVTSEGRGSKVEVLPGGENLGDIDDLRYFNNKMLRALGVPSSYLPTGPEDGTAAPSDGKVGTAFIQEFRFSKVVTRYQQQIIEPLDDEFKLFIKHRGITIDNSLFNLKFTPAQSFSEYRQLELDSARINTFTALMDVPYISKRFVLKTYLAWTEEQMAENERMWKEERSRLTKTFAPEQGAGGGSPTSGLSDVGITSSGIDGMAPEGDDSGAAPEGGGGVSDVEVDNFGGQ